MFEGIDSAARLDAWIASKVPSLSRRRAKELIAAGEITLNGRQVKKGLDLKSGDKVEIWTEPAPADWTPVASRDWELEVVFEDEHLVVVDKRSGIPSVPLSPEETETVANALAARFPECARIGRSPGDGGLVQRLDTETSGLMIAARAEPVHRRLLVMQSAGEIEKTYIALARRHGAELPGAIDAPLGPAGPGRRTVKATPDGVPAETTLKLIQTIGEWLLVEAVIHRGQRHQIRAHLAHAGFPIAGDKLYGPEAAPAGLRRLFLHASRLRLIHPVTEETLEIKSDLPQELREVVRTLGGRPV